MNELPAIGSSSLSSTAALLANYGALNNNAANAAGMGQLHQAMQQFNAPPSKTITIVNPKKEPAVAATRRLVQVFIADPHESVPLAQSLIYRGEQRLTDLTDQELFFEIDIKTLLDAHNAERVKLIDKAVKERAEHLEPARIRDLKMVVVNVATF